MKALWTTVCVIGLAGAASAALTTTATTTASETVMNSAVIEGVIESIAEDKKSFGLRTAEDSLSIKVTDQTAYTLNGEASTMDEAVQAGRDAKVTHMDGVASKVDVTTEA